MNAPGRGRARCVGLCAMLAAVTLLTGCIIVPVDYTQAGSRHNVSEQTAATLQPGEITKEEVLLRFGEPDWVSDDERLVGYLWTKVKALVLYGAYYTGGIAEVPKSSLLKLEFDAEDRLVSATVASEWGETVAPETAPTEP
jgi:outer membrane protein assembly factor BamE (lipoprotein component of BamABCDE complex)